MNILKMLPPLPYVRIFLNMESSGVKLITFPLITLIRLLTSLRHLQIKLIMKKNQNVIYEPLHKM